ncbi:MAG: hypothetical protein HQ450_10870 [Alcaligenaceae bacterium]|nr:hypothetical protein [Alcaligenaceae bacterium]
MAQMFRITLSAALVLLAATTVLPSSTLAQSGLRFNPGGAAPSGPYSTSGSILDLMPAPQSDAPTQPDPAAAKPEPAAEPVSGSATAAPAKTEPSEPTIHQGLSPEKANPAGGLSPIRGAAPPPVSPEASTGGQSPYLAPSPYASPRSPGGGLKIR